MFNIEKRKKSNMKNCRVNRIIKTYPLCIIFLFIFIFILLRSMRPRKALRTLATYEHAGPIHHKIHFLSQ